MSGRREFDSRRVDCVRGRRVESTRCERVPSGFESRRTPQSHQRVGERFSHSAWNRDDAGSTPAALTDGPVAHLGERLLCTQEEPVRVRPGPRFAWVFVRDAIAEVAGATPADFTAWAAIWDRAGLQNLRVGFDSPVARDAVQVHRSVPRPGGRHRKAADCNSAHPGADPGLVSNAPEVFKAASLTASQWAGFDSPAGALTHVWPNG
jgi:hypothetical protein